MNMVTDDEIKFEWKLEDEDYAKAMKIDFKWDEQQRPVKRCTCTLPDYERDIPKCRICGGIKEQQ